MIIKQLHTQIITAWYKVENMTLKKIDYCVIKKEKNILKLLYSQIYVYYKKKIYFKAKNRYIDTLFPEKEIQLFQLKYLLSFYIYMI